MPLLRRRVERVAEHRYRVRLPEEERSLLRSLAEELRSLLSASTDDHLVRRLFPVAYHDDAERDHEYQALVRDELLDRRLATIEVLEATADATEVDGDQLAAWMAVINDLRLVLGTKLDVDEDMEPVDLDDPDAPALAVYEYLGYLLHEVVDALTDDLPPPVEGTGG
jgi:hypothetical protein